MTNTANWNANTIRLTAFAEANFHIDKDWWEQVVGEAPETEISQAKTGIRQYEGNFANGKLILIVNQAQTRIDWVYAAPEIQEPLTNIPTIGTLSQELSLFLQIMEKWFKSEIKHSFTRLALGLVVYQAIDNRKMGYELLVSQYLRFNPNLDENTSDFSYQINRKRRSQVVNNMMINRLMKWSVSSIKTIIVAPVQQSLPESFAILLELDINSAPEYENGIDPEKATSLLGEYSRLAQEIIEKGDIS